MKTFNTTGVCLPQKHYMVNIDGKLQSIMKMISAGKYFTINRARQYGKTTTLQSLEKVLLDNDYSCIRISFEGLGDKSFSSAAFFCQEFLEQVYAALHPHDADYASSWLNKSVDDFAPLNRHISSLCEKRKVILIIDEVDKASNNSIFLHFLGMLRNQYLEREKKAAFHSVILAGVYDIRNVKIKLINEGLHTKPGDPERLLNSPWNIASDFDVDMSFNPIEISTMLTEYEHDNQTGMNIMLTAEEIFKFSSGYPYLVSRICQLIDEKFDKEWTVNGVLNAVKYITAIEINTLFEDLFKNIKNNRGIYNFLYDILISGNKRPRDRFNSDVEWCRMFGIITTGINNEVGISNKIFESVLVGHFIDAEPEANKISDETCNILRYDIIREGKFDIELCLRKFSEFYTSIFTQSDIPYLEKQARLIFIAYLHPLVNGQGFYHLESQLTDSRRMDIVVNFAGDLFIIELKLWRGEAARDRAYEQLLGYMSKKQVDNGYLLTFDLRKNSKKEHKAEWVDFDGRRIFDIII